MTEDFAAAPEDAVSERPSRRFALSAAGAALVAAIAVPGHAPGLGIAVAALAAGAAVFAADPHRLSPWQWAWTGSGLALAAVAVIRDAPWVVAVDLLAALGLATLAVTDPSTWFAMAAAPLRVLVRLPKAPGFVLDPLRRESPAGERRRLRPALRGAAIAAALLTVFGTLFASADGAFAHIAGQVLWPNWDLRLLPAHVIVFAVGAVAIGALALARPRFEALGPSFDQMAWRDAFDSQGEGPRGLGRTEWAIALGALDLLFAAFVIVQLAVLFGGSRHVVQTAGLTYAEYARQGFFQLLAVGALTLGVVAGAVRLARREAARDERLLKGLLGVLCALAIVVLFSAFRRLGLYEDAFGFTIDRLVPHAVMVWMAGVFALVLAAGAIPGGWLPRAVVAFTAGSLLVFSLVNPDALIASRNVARYAATGKLDTVYLARNLSADAVPALARLPEPLRSCTLGPLARTLQRPNDGWGGFNLSRTRARTLLATLEPISAPVCAAAPVEEP